MLAQAAQIMGQCNLGSRHLALSGLAPKLDKGLVRLPDSGSAEGMSTGHQASTGIDHNLPAKISPPFLHKSAAFPFLAETQFLIFDYF